MFAFSPGSAAAGFVAALVLGAIACWRLRKRTGAPQTEERELPAWFYWLADAPMFIDDRLVSSFYDAVLRPGYRTTSIELSEQHTTSSTDKSSFGLKAAQVIPGLAEVSVGSEVSATRSFTRGESRTLVPIQNAPRELVNLAVHYLRNYYPAVPKKTADARSNAGETSAAANKTSPSTPDRSPPTPDERGDCRIWEELADPSRRNWEAPERTRIESRPRMLAFLDFPGGTKFIPMAVETDKGVVAVYEDLVKNLLGPNRQACPSYPDNPSDPDFAQKSNEYWQWFNGNWNAGKALVALEKATESAGRPRWVNYRVPVQDGLTLHLNVVGHGDYDTGVFAYNLIKRGWRQGVRVVGTVRAEPGLNVLAIYDK